jgi:hypothetical protein
MTRFEVIGELKEYFDIKELVSEQVYKKYKERAWSFFSIELLETLLVLRRDILQCPMIINNWFNKGSYSQRGLRCNMDPIVKEKTVIYLGAHCLGQGLDFHTNKYSPSECRKIIKEKQDLLPYAIRLEDDKSAPTWVHFDVCNITEDKVVEFSA